MFGNKEFIEQSKQIVHDYAVEHMDKTDAVPPFVVWSCKTLQNHKALLSTTLPSGTSNGKTFTVTVTNEGPGKVVLTDADADIAAHRADSSFYVGFVANFAYNSGLSYRGGLNTNHALSDGSTYGFYMRTNSSGANSYSFITTAPTASGAEIGTTTDGEIFVYATSTLILQAGTYTIFCGW